MKLKKLRQDRGYTQQKLSALSGVSYIMIAGYESGDRSFLDASVSTVHKLAEALGCTIDYLMGWQELEEEIINSGLKEYNSYINDGLVKEDAKERLNIYLYRRFNEYRDCVNLDALTNKIVEQYNKSK